MSLSMWFDKVATHERPTAVKNAIAGNTPTWAAQTSNVACAVYPKGSTESRTFMRRDLVGSHCIVAGSDLAVKPGDRFSFSGESGYYLVNGFEKFTNAAIGTEVVYAIDVTRRTV